MKILQLKNIKKSFNNKNVLKNISLNIYEGEKIAIIGKNGAGKSTLLNIIVGLLNSDSGNINFYFNKKDGLKMMPQDDILIDDLKVYEQLSLSGLINGNNKNTNYDKLLKDFNLYDVRKKYVSDISGGQKRKLSFLTNMTSESKLLMLDEPTVGMDLDSIEMFWNYLDNLSATTLTVTHNFNEIDDYFSRIICIDNGKIQADESVDSIHRSGNNVKSWYVSLKGADKID